MPGCFIFFLFFQKSGADEGSRVGGGHPSRSEAFFSTLQRLAPLQSHNSHLAVLRQMTLRALRCDGRVPRKSRYSRSGKPPPRPMFAENRSTRDANSCCFHPLLCIRGGATGGSQRSNWKTFPDPRLFRFRRRWAETFSRRREPPWQPPCRDANSKKRRWSGFEIRSPLSPVQTNRFTTGRSMRPMRGSAVRRAPRGQTSMQQ